MDQIVLLAGGTSEERAAMAWLAATKYAALVREFAADVLRSKLADFDSVLRPSDYNNFLVARLPSHPELGELTESSSKKVRRVLLLMLTEAEPDYDKPYSTSLDECQEKKCIFLPGFVLLWTVSDYVMVEAAGVEPASGNLPLHFLRTYLLF